MMIDKPKATVGHKPFQYFRLALTALLLCVQGNDARPQPFSRQANTTLAMPATPTSGALSYVLVDGLNELQFVNPVAIRSVPSETTRLFVVERAGKIIVATNLANANKTVFLDITDRVSSDYDRLKTEGLTSLAFHPNYAQNGLFYVTYCWRENNQNYNRLSEFKVSTNPNAADKTSERVLISQFDEGDGHNFNDVHFGPDGYLYMLTGDEGDGGSGDDFNNAQRIDKDFFAGMLRIDPIRKTGQVIPTAHPAIVGEYGIPADNPFVGATQLNGQPIDPAKLRAEFWAIGLRNPWRFSFDPVAGTIYEGDVGQHGREEINIISKGGNYGWAYKEGNQAGPKGSAPAAAVLTGPLVEYANGFGPDQGYSVTGGVVYRGTRFPELSGDYIYADYVSGNVWALRWDNGLVNGPRLLTKATEIAGFGYDPRNGDVLLINHYGGRIWRLEYRTNGGSNLPQKLSATGAFANLASLTPHPGIVPYDLNAPFWSDNATKKRWFSVPDLSKKMLFAPEGNWTFPDGTIWIKHFELEMKRGDPSSTRRIETRFLVKNSSGVYGVTYKWDADQNDATLVAEGGLSEALTIQDGGGTRQQVWRYPSRSECVSCHTKGGGYALGFNTAQLNRNFVFPGNTTNNQLKAWSDVGYFQQPVTNLFGLKTMAAMNDERFSRALRAKSYLAANCSFCHQPGAVGHANFDARFETPLSESGLINSSLNNSGDAGHRTILAGDPNKSAIVQRMKVFGSSRMPPIGSNLIDEEGVRLLESWIRDDLAGHKTFAQWQQQHFNSTVTSEALATADPDGDGNANKIEYLTGTDPKKETEAWKPGITRAREVKFRALPHLAFVLEAASGFDRPVRWEPWKDPANAPFYAPVGADKTLTPPASGERGYFRVRVLEP